MLIQIVDRLYRHDATAGILLMLATVAALAIYNSPLASGYDAELSSVLAITLDGDGLEKPLILWINDGLMAIFFFLIGLELKREMIEGKLRNPRDVMLPGIAALGGVAVPALIYTALNLGGPGLDGWAIPAATDIAFALGVLALLGKRAPAALKMFLLTLAILDDIAAILIIALFYTAELKVNYLVYGLVPLALLIALNLRGAHRVAPSILLGTILWVLVLKSGVHATLAGVVLALTIPLRDARGGSPVHKLEYALTPYVLYLIMPLFAFANAGLSLDGLGLDELLNPVTLGIALGLFAGKQIGVFGFTWGLVRSGLASLPDGVGWRHIYGVSCLAGIGFTMSLFIGGLSFADPDLRDAVRLGVLAGSILSGVLGFAVLFGAGRPAGTEAARPEPDEAVSAAERKEPVVPPA
ncbi:Na+/H+ antiporter NhaA [Rhodobacteraceae bacterium 2CG4]|uniref:Na(+)/H(+) antiporter NhaA n=1 Tax=Halovulum marinum TaxID=2662447 RepID=A0A6L5Z3F1_9RHOB|nr:Na+/H+ antiporter NhaA [Halovulum marinum]MSU91057.1 Na+/H+ antiporter NhaA [Halovulum marinum]